MYRKATWIIRNHHGTHSTTDGCDFRISENDQMIKSGKKGCLVNARVLYYGWVKNPQILQRKFAYQQSCHDGEDLSRKEIDGRTAFLAQFPNCGILKTFRDTHPQAMAPRIRVGDLSELDGIDG